MQSRPAQSGFSLVELSIVLVILGLLTGGILGGQALIRAAELRAVSTEYSRWATATQTFRDKYFAYPGDMRNATQFWGRMNGNADCVTNSTPAAAVSAAGACDGNADGVLSFAASASQVSEQMQFWRHMALAGLIEGTFTGVAGPVGVQDCPFGSACPRSKLSNAGWGVQTAGNFPGNFTAYAMDYGTLLMVGASVSGGLAQGAVLRPEEAWNLDTKLDDGRPAQGKVIALYWNNACAAADDGSSSNNDLNSSYRLSDASIQCALYFRQVF